MRINQNIAALNTYNKLTANNTATGKSLEKLSSGLRINRAGDDAAGLAISEKMRAQVRGLDQASRNSQDAISLIQTAEGALNETHSILQRMRELSVQAANDTNVAVDRGEIQKEINQLTSEINRIGNTTEFNTMKLLDGSKITGTASTSSSLVTTAAANKTAASLDIAAADVSYADSGQPTFQSGNIAVASGSGFVFGTGSGSGTVTITRDSGDTVLVTVSGEYSSGNVSGQTIITADSSGKYSFNDLGVSFTITSIAGWESGATGAITYNKSGDVAVDNNLSTEQKLWTIISGSSGTTAFNTVLSGDVDIASGLAQGIYKVSISSSAGESGAITITREGLSGGSGNGILDIVDSLSGVQDGFVYDQNGVTFNIENLSGLGDTGGSGTFSFTVVDEVRATTTTAGTADTSLTFQIGANQNQSMSLSISDMRSKALGISSATGSGAFVSVSSGSNVTDGTNSTNSEYSLDVSSASKAAASITVINAAIEQVSSERAKLGAVQNRLEHTINNLGTSSENLTAAESRIRDVDMAREMMNFTKNNILSQAAQSMLAQANQQPQGVLQLLR